MVSIIPTIVFISTNTQTHIIYPKAEKMYVIIAITKKQSNKSLNTHNIPKKGNNKNLPLIIIFFIITFFT